MTIPNTIDSIFDYALNEQVGNKLSTPNQMVPHSRAVPRFHSSSVSRRASCTPVN